MVRTIRPMEILSDGTQQAKFQYDFALDGKALSADVDENGDLWIEGYASDFGVDRQEEAFEPGAFERGLKSFLERNPIMLYHHQYDKALGQFVDARVDGNGLWVKGRVDAPAVGSWAEDVFNKIRKGTIKAFSVGGIFRRRQTPQGPRIYDVDLGEISVTPFPVNPRTTFALAARKAFETEVADEVVVTGPTSHPECAVCKARVEAEAKEEQERKDAERKEAEEASAREETERIAAEAQATEDETKRREEEVEALAELVKRLDALGVNLDAVGNRFLTAKHTEVTPSGTSVSQGSVASDG